MRQKTKNPLRCFCSRQPILAFYGLDENDERYIHIKVYKARRIYGEIIMTEGVIFIRCRECLRWYKLIIRQNKTPRLEETDPPKGSVDSIDHVHG